MKKKILMLILWAFSVLLVVGLVAVAVFSPLGAGIKLPPLEELLPLGPTVTPTPTVTPSPTPEIIISDWEAVARMQSECAGRKMISEMSADDWDEIMEKSEPYSDQLMQAASYRTEQVGRVQSGRWCQISGSPTFSSSASNPFVVPLTEDTVFSEILCERYLVFYECVYTHIERPVISPVPPVPVDEGYLFYEVGGVKPFVFDGVLREIHFRFSTPPSVTPTP